MEKQHSPPSTFPPYPLLHRACEQCNRKKTKCDMQRPICGLCYRTGQHCQFPTYRRKPHENKDRVKTKRKRDQCASYQNSHSLPSGPMSISSECSQTGTNDLLSEGVSPELSMQLVNLFFSKIQQWLPLFHRPMFYQTYIDPETNNLLNMADLSMEERLIFWSIFALAARHYSVGNWSSIPASERGTKFAAKAIQVYDHLRNNASCSSQLFLQGCVLLAYYHSTSILNHQSWILIGVCVRMAYDLNLHRIDAELDNSSRDIEDYTDRWLFKEGLRRTWWLVWELDRFSSILSQRPYAIDHRSIRVYLPVSDHYWFTRRPIKSSMLDRNPHKAWRSLQGTENQNERAWFLICNHILSLVYDIHNQDVIGEEESVPDIETALNCFRLSLPPHFNLAQNPPVFGSSESSQYNWIISTNLLLLSARASCDMARVQPYDITTKRLQMHASELLQIMNIWPTDYIGVCQPFIACTLVGPKSVFMESCWHTPEPKSSDPALVKEIVELGLKHFARHWNLASMLLKLEAIHKAPKDHSDYGVSSQLKEFVPRFLSLLPDRIRSKLSSSESPFLSSTPTGTRRQRSMDGIDYSKSASFLSRTPNIGANSGHPHERETLNTQWPELFDLSTNWGGQIEMGTCVDIGELDSIWLDLPEGLSDDLSKGKLAEKFQ